MKILLALIKKEIKQILRDPSSIIIAFILPLISILIYQSHLPLFSVDKLPYFKTNKNNDEILVLFDGKFDGKYVL